MSQNIGKRRSTRTPGVFQTEACECGAASLSMILRYYKCEVPMEQIRYECGINRDGCSAADLILAGKKFGLISKGFKVPLENLKKAPMPCIIHWNFNHFIVLEKVTDTYARINDPAAGHRKITLKELDDAYTGIVLTFEPGPDFKENRLPSGIADIFKDRLGMDKEAVTYMLLTGLLLMAPGLMTPILSQKFIDNVFSSSTSYILSLVLCIGIVYAFQAVFTYYRSMVLSRFKVKIAAVSSNALIRKALRLPILFYEQRYSGELSRRVEINGEVNDFLAGSFTETVLNAITSVAYLMAMLWYSRILTVIGVTGAFVSIGVSYLVLKPIAELNMKSKQDQCRMSGMLTAGISVADSIKASGVENEYTAEILDTYARTTESEQSLGFTQQIVSSLPSACSNMFTVLVMTVGSALVMQGHLTIGVLTAFTQLLSSFITPVNDIIGFTQSVQQMKAGYSKLEDIHGAKIDAKFRENEARENSTMNKKLQGRIEISKLEFGYNPAVPPIINDLSLKIGPGMRVAVVGSSGSGKSTLGKLLSGTLEPWSGEIKLDGVPLFDIPQKWLCSSMAVISQRSNIFYGTVRENLTMWNEEYSDQMMYKAIQDADAMSVISSLPGTYEYMLEEGGKNLSGGQRQKLEIARALMINPSILIMDEATSALDALSEQKIMSNIRARGCTCVIIAHRLSSIRDCDGIIVLDEGKIAEIGTHEQLLAKHGIYEKLIMN